MPSGRSNAEVGRERDLLDASSTLSGEPLTRVVRAVDLDVVEAAPRACARRPAGLLLDLAGGLDAAVPSDVDVRDSVRAVAERRAQRVRVLDDDVVHRDAQLVAAIWA